MINEPIIALATPPLKSALALIRLSGESVFEITDRFFSQPISEKKEKGLFYGSFSYKGMLVDQVMVLVYPGPNSMTGEDVVEISCHGSMVIVKQIVEAYLSAGARFATAGEFSSRAFYNGKMDLIEAEAVNDMINATTVESKNLALLSLTGKTSKLVLPLQKEISDMLALIEVGIDFPEYDEEERISASDIESRCKAIHLRIKELIARGEEGRIYREGISIAIVGKPNVGKSSILNALLQTDKAIVSPIPGTTRDIVEGDISLKGIPIHLLDTAGIRDSEDVIERIGVKRSLDSISKADVVLFVRDASQKEDQADLDLLQLCQGKKVINVYNKADLIKKEGDNGVFVSALHNDIEPLKDAIYQILGVSEDAYTLPSLSNARELALLRSIDDDVTEARRNAEQGVLLDLVSVSLQSAYNKVRTLLGQDVTHDLTDEIFSRFCVGK